MPRSKRASRLRWTGSRSFITACSKLYFGPEFALDGELDLECLRIPHFYRSFYVYKYATGLSAAMALVDRVAGGGPAELDDYLAFLKGGCSKGPVGAVARRRRDMEQPDCVRRALDRFAETSRSWTS